MTSIKPTLAAAEENLRSLLRAAGNESTPWRRDLNALDDYPDYAFLVRVGACDRRVLMPGCSLDVLVNGWPETICTPRITVDGNTWLYKYAIDFFIPEFNGEEPDGGLTSRHGFRSHLLNYELQRRLPRTEESK